jgi:alkyldihydroxyacetonephosphate synthase
MKFYGWGYEDQTVSDQEIREMEAIWAKTLGIDSFDVTPAPTLEEIKIAPPRVMPPLSLAHITTVEKYDRLAHTYGSSIHDYARAFLREFSNPPDIVAYPENDGDVSAILDWCGSVDVAVVPYGGGSSVVGGVEPPRDPRYRGTLSLDMRNFDRVIEIDPVSEAARIQGGVFGPHLEEQLKPSGLTMRFFLQSFEFSTLGGWIATRAAGHYATVATQIDDYVQNLRVVTPAGICESRRFPASGAGPAPDRMFIGSEGSLGVITEAWIRLRKRPQFRAAATVRFADFYVGAEAVRALSQSGLYPANCRLIDANEAAFTGAGDGTASLLVLGFESADQPINESMRRALELCADYGGEVDRKNEASGEAHRTGAAGKWRDTFMRAPYYREHALARGVMRETFETAITWDRFKSFHADFMAAIRKAVEDITGRPGLVTCRFTHIYPDGPAPYFTYHAYGDQARLKEQFWHLKVAISAAMARLGGTITHHHAVGRDHREWYDKERPDLFGRALRAAKGVLDPHWIMNPGAIVDRSPQV